MSKQIAVLLDNSGSMFQPVGGGNASLKIYETARGAEFFLQNIIDRLAGNPGSQFAISVHHFATTYSLLPGGNQVDSSSPGFAGALTALKGSIPAIESQPVVQVVLGNLTDLYDAVRRTADFLVNASNQPGFGAPTSRALYVFSDGIQTVTHNGLTTMAGYEAEQGVTFNNLLNGRGIRLIAWGVGSDALGDVLEQLKNQAFPGGTNPVSDSKVLFPVDETGTFPNCTTIIMNNAFDIVDNNGVLPLRPVGKPAVGLLWEQFSLPRTGFSDLQSATNVLSHVPSVNYSDFEVDVDGSTKELILGLVSHSLRARPTLEVTSPSGVAFSSGSAGTRTVEVATATALKIVTPEEGTWRVRVKGDAHKTPGVVDLMARAAFPEFSLEVSATPHQIVSPGKVTIVAWPRLDGQPVKAQLEVRATALGGASVDLQQQNDGAYVGPLEITRPGVNIVRVDLKGKLDDGKSILRSKFTIVLLGAARDPRFTVAPDTYAQGEKYSVEVRLRDARFTRRTQVSFGSGIHTSSFRVLNDDLAIAEIEVTPTAFIGDREAVTFDPEAESTGTVRVVAGKPQPGTHARIRCLRFDAAGNLVGIVLDSGQNVCISLHDERLQKLLERVRDQNLTIQIHTDAQGCLTGFEICR